MWINNSLTVALIRGWSAPHDTRHRLAARSSLVTSDISDIFSDVKPDESHCTTTTHVPGVPAFRQ